jgi:hypothetical protein
MADLLCYDKFMKTPATLTLDELAKIADTAARKADHEARVASIEVAGELHERYAKKRSAGAEKADPDAKKLNVKNWRASAKESRRG